MKRHVFDAANAQMEMTISLPELAVRLIEAMVGADRPRDMSAVQCLLDLKERSPDIYDQALELAQVASDYFVEAVQTAYDEREHLQ